MIEWGVPENFRFLWALPALALLFLFASWRKRRLMRRFGDEPMMVKLARSFNSASRTAKRALLLLAVLCIVLALCQPHLKTREVEVERKGVDVMIAIDVSRSMLARDIAPNRLEKAKLELSTLVDKLKGDRIGVIAFAGDAFIMCPLTLDRNAVKLFIATVNPNIIPTPGTAIGQAIRVAVQAFDERDREHKALILLTDGEDHESDPLGAAEKARAAAVHVHTIGIGTPEGGTIPGEGAGEGFKKDRQGKVVLSRLDEGLLKKISQRTGGRFYRSSRGELEIDAIAAEVRGMTQKGFRKDKIIEYEENYQYFLILAFIFLSLEILLSERRPAKKEPAGLRRAVMMLLLMLTPFMCGFEFYSAVKNQQGNKLYSKNQVGKAKAAYSDALKSEPRSPEIAFNLGNAYYKEGNFDKALSSYAAAAKSQAATPVKPKAFYNLGNSWVMRKDPKQAIEYYKQALRGDPGDEDAKYDLEQLLKQQDKKQDQQKDQKKDQDQKDQQKDQGGQGGSGQKDQKDKPEQGGSGQKDQQEKQDQQDKQDKQDNQDKQDQGRQQQDKEDQQPQEQGHQDDKDPQEKQQQQDQQKDQQSSQPQAKEEEQPKSPQQQRAEQILAALENEEKQIFKAENNKNPMRRAQKYVDKDW